MRRAAEIAAQVFTARDALLRDTAEDLRVAFLLLDSATETLTVRRIGGAMSLGKWEWGHFAHLTGWDVIPVDLNDFEQKERETAVASDGFVRWQLSDSQKRKLDREFESKLKLLAWDGDIPVPYVSVLGRLHEYRNEMYHREESRPETLRVVVHLYAWLVADLLDQLQAGWFSHSSLDPDDLAERTYARMGRDAPSGREQFGEGFSMQSQMAEALRRDLDLASASELLANYVGSRMESLHEAIRSCGEFIGSVQRVENVTEMDVVRALYATDPMVGIEKLRGVSVPVKRAMIQRWDAWAGQIRALPEPIEAFRSLARFEAEFEEFETKVKDLTFAIDREIQFQVDLARGK